MKGATRTVFLSLSVSKDVCSEAVVKALVPVLNGLRVDTLGTVTLHKVTVDQHHGYGAKRYTDRYRWTK